MLAVAANASATALPRTYLYTFEEQILRDVWIACDETLVLLSLECFFPPCNAKLESRTAAQKIIIIN
jgi:hypothetical protein